MAYTLGNKCAKNISKRIVLLQLIIENVVTCFFGTHAVYYYYYYYYYYYHYLPTSTQAVSKNVNGCNGDATHSVITVFWKATAFPCWRPWTGVGTKTWFPYRPLLVMIVMCQPVEATAPRCDAGAG